MKRLAAALSAKLGYKVWRSTVSKPNRDNVKYGFSTDKITQYKWFEEHGVPALVFTESQGVAKKWVAEGLTVVGRAFTNSQCGKGIKLLEPGQIVPELPVYTVYKKKKREFRVNVFRGKLVRVTEKKLKNGWEKGPSKIRNLENGYVFCNVDLSECPAGLVELAVKASAVVKSDFAGVDIGYNEKSKELFVIEVNSAPGIEGTTVQEYVNVIVGAM